MRRKPKSKRAARRSSPALGPGHRQPEKPAAEQDQAARLWHGCRVHRHGVEHDAADAAAGVGPWPDPSGAGGRDDREAGAEIPGDRWTWNPSFVLCPLSAWRAERRFAVSSGRQVGFYPLRGPDAPWTWMG